MRALRRLLAAVLTLAALAVSGAAHAWTEARPTGLRTDVTVEPDGAATVALRVRWAVLGGRMQEFDVVDLPADLALLEAGAVTSTGATLPVSARVASGGRLVVALGDERHGVGRGTVDVLLRYRTSLLAQGSIHRAGADVIVEFRTAPWARGLEGVELRVALPRGARQAQWMRDDTPGIETSSAQENDRDVIQAVRRHLPAHERWVARVAVDAAVFPWLTAQPAHRPGAARESAPPWRTAGVLGAASLALAALVLRSLRRATSAPPTGRKGLALAVGAVGVALPSLHVVGVPYALPGGVALALLALGALLPSPAPRGVAPAAPPRPLRDEVRVALWRAATPRGRAAALALAFIAAATGIAGASLGHPWTAVAGAELSLAALAWAAWMARVTAPGDLAALVPLERELARIARRGGRARTSWRVRGDAALRGSVRVRIVPQRASRFARGVRSVECEACSAPGAIVETVAPTLVVRVESGSPCERGLRLLATRVGAITARPEEGETVYRCVLLGVERDLALAGLAAMMNELFTRAEATERASERRPADEALADAGTAG